MLLADRNCLLEIANADDSRRRLHERAYLGHRDRNRVQIQRRERIANMLDQVAKDDGILR